MRCADLGPTPGRRPSSSMRSWTGPAYRPVTTVAEQPPPRQAAEVEAAERRRAHACCSSRDLADGVVQRGQHEVLQHLDVVGIDRRRVDRRPSWNSMAPVTHDLHHAAAGDALDHRVGRLLLGGQQLLLHLWRLLEQRAHVEAASRRTARRRAGRWAARATPRRVGWVGLSSVGHECS